MELSDELCNEDILTENAQLRKQKLKTQDKLRVERRNQRDSDRKENATEELLTEIHDNLKSIGKSLKVQTEVFRKV